MTQELFPVTDGNAQMSKALQVWKLHNRSRREELGLSLRAAVRAKALASGLWKETRWVLSLLFPQWGKQHSVDVILMNLSQKGRSPGPISAPNMNLGESLAHSKSQQARSNKIGNREIPNISLTPLILCL